MGKIKDTLHSPDIAVRWLGPYPPRDPTEEEMTGFQSKKAISASRHADDVTMAELVRLRVENDNLKKELEEAKLCSCRKREKELDQMFAYFEDPFGTNKFNGGE